MINDVSSRLSDVLPDDTWFYPGHRDDSTLGEQKPRIDEWRERGW
ncbi:glyoxylase-like metal-dependent hydrolase (beta-lactamase superfamily II) [Kibdelosporangium banguiense]|uniref:Glyoxylase-like metal-dependent hydrolase (Beta-lactamase superfamily II) n=1 Tax=Kibdelosporangium banguiense TaxID=1365924 RepID=A0ABS4TKQ7_9PSEU|nr:glyoxylase-like metal-dependent hydrolase (beta-lactamase superfamily II) [Kibdelosporangium banguiense]